MRLKAARQRSLRFKGAGCVEIAVVSDAELDGAIEEEPDAETVQLWLRVSRELLLAERLLPMSRPVAIGAEAAVSDVMMHM